MPGPRNADEAKSWIQSAMDAGRYVLAKHFRDQAYNRGLSVFDVETAVARMTRIRVYEGTTQEPATPRHDGTCWRVYGPNVDGDCVPVCSLMQPPTG